MIAASGRFDLPFTCVDSTGAATSPTGTPTGVLVKNGTDLGTTVTVTMTGAQGIASCTIPSDASVGDRFYIRISAVVSAVTYVVAGPAETVDKTIDSRATQASVDTVDDFLDTEIAAIKAKTDNLPSDPADQSAVEAAITAATSVLATQTSVNTIDDLLDTEIAAIQTAIADIPTNAELTTAINTGRTTAMTESYPTLGAAPTLEQAMFVLMAHMNEAEISGTTKTIKKLDGTTAAATFTLDSATAPTSITRAT